MRELAEVSMRLVHGATVEEINAAFEAHQFPKLERKVSQMAMLRVVERVGESATVQQVVAQECASLPPDQLVSKGLENVGFKALVTTLAGSAAANNSLKAEEVITSFQPADFAPVEVRKVEEEFAKMIHVSNPELVVAQVNETLAEMRQRDEIDSGVKRAGVTEVTSEMVMAMSSQASVAEVSSSRTTEKQSGRSSTPQSLALRRDL